MTSNTRSKREIHIEEKCCEYAESLGFEHSKFKKRGWPDRLFLGPLCQTILVEFKRPGQKARPQQTGLHRRLAEQGHQVHVIDTLDDFKALIG